MGLELYSSTVNSSRYAPDDNIWIGSRVRGLARCTTSLSQFRQFESTLSASRCRDDLSPTSACVASVDRCVCGLDVTLPRPDKDAIQLSFLYPDERVLAAFLTMPFSLFIVRTN